MSEKEPLVGDQFVIELEAKMTARTAECTCSEVADHLFELLDAQMPKEQEARLQAHAQSCPHCNEMAEAEVHVREIVKRSCCESAPSTLREKISRQIFVFRSTTTNQ